jgi:tape measure domain-containing protein
MPNIVGGTVVWNLDVDNSKLRSGLASAKTLVDGSAKSIQNSFGGLDKSFGKIGSGIASALKKPATALAGIGESILGFSKKAAIGLGVATTAASVFSFKSASDFEQARIAFDTMLGSVEKGRKMMGELSDFARKTPFELPEVVTGAKQLLAYGIEAEKIIPTFTALGNISAGVGRDKLPQLVLAYGQVRTATKLTGNELRQFTEAGVPLLESLTKVMGKSAAQIKEDMADGVAPSFEQVQKAIFGLSGEGGKFFNLMDKQSKTFGGVMSNLSDNLGRVARNVIGLSDTGDVIKDGLFDKVSKAAQQLLDWVDKNKDAIIAFAQGAIQTAIVWGGKFIAIIKQVVGWLQQHQKVAKAIAVALGIFVVAAIAAAAIAAVVAAGWGLAVAAIIGGVTFLASMFVQNWDKIKTAALDLWDKISKAFTTGFNFIVNGLKWLANNWTYVIGFMIGFVLTLPLKMGLAIGAGIKRIISAIMGVNWGAVWEVIKRSFFSMVDSLTVAMQRLWNWMKHLDWRGIAVGALKGIANSIIGLLEGVVNGALSGIHLGPVRIPRLATGTQNWGGGMAMMGETGREIAALPQGSKVYPHNESMNMLRNANKESGNTFNITIQGAFARSKMELADLMVDALKVANDRIVGAGKPAIINI